MAFYKFNKNARTDENTGFGTNASIYGGRFINKNGTANVVKRGVHFLLLLTFYT